MNSADQALKQMIFDYQAEILERLLAPLKEHMNDVLAVEFISAIWSDYAFLIGDDDIYQIVMYVPSSLYNDRFVIKIVPPSSFGTFEEWVHYMKNEFICRLWDAMDYYVYDDDGFSWSDFRNPELAEHLIKLGVKRTDLEEAYAEWD